MDVTLNPWLEKKLKDLEGQGKDASEFVNAVMLSYFNGEFIRRSEVAGMVVTKPLYRSSFVSKFSYEDTVKKFAGVVVGGSVEESESLFIASEKLRDLLEEHQVVLVMNTPRSKPIPVTAPDSTLFPTYGELEL